MTYSGAFSGSAGGGASLASLCSVGAGPSPVVSASEEVQRVYRRVSKRLIGFKAIHFIICTRLSLRSCIMRVESL